MKRMTIHVVTEAEEMGSSLTFTKFGYLIGCLKGSQVAPRGLNVALRIFDVCARLSVFPAHLTGKSY